MTSATIGYDSYEWGGRAERLLRVGAGAPRVMLLAPLFEEANKTRRFLVEIMRALADRGIASALPDLPGTLESSATLAELEWSDWTGAADTAACATGAHYIASFRGGALLDAVGGVRVRWRLTPADGVALLRDLVRVQTASLREDGMNATAAEIERKALGEPITIAGYDFAPGFLAGMRAQTLDRAEPPRIVRLATDMLPADAKIEAPPLWRRSEPGEDRAFSQAVATDIAEWVKSCDGH